MDDAPRARRLKAPRAVPNRPGISTRELIGPEDGVGELFVGEGLCTPGAGVPLHRHAVVEAFVVLEGVLSVRLSDRTIDVQADESLAVPPGTPHAFGNRGDVPVRYLFAAPWDHRTFYTAATVYLEGQPPGE